MAISNPFKGDPEKKLQRELETLRGKRDGLIASLKTEEELVLQLQATADEVCDGTKNPAFLAAQADVRAAQDNIATFTRVLAATNDQLKKAELELAQISEKRVRAETATEIERRRVAFLASASTFVNAAVHLADAAASLGEAVIDVRQIEGFARDMRLGYPTCGSDG